MTGHHAVTDPNSRLFADAAEKRATMLVGVRHLAIQIRETADPRHPGPGRRGYQHQGHTSYPDFTCISHCGLPSRSHNQWEACFTHPGHRSCSHPLAQECVAAREASPLRTLTLDWQEPGGCGWYKNQGPRLCECTTSTETDCVQYRCRGCRGSHN